MSGEFKQSVYDIGIKFGKTLEDAVKETIQHSQELKEKEKAVEIQKNQVKIVSQIENLEEDMIKLWLSYLKEEKGITVGYGKNGEGRPVIKKKAGKFCVFLPSSVDGISMETDLNNLCEHDWDGFKDYMGRKAVEVRTELFDTQGKYWTVLNKRDRTRNEIQDLQEEFCVSMEFSVRSQKKRMVNDRLDEIDRLNLEGKSLEEKISKTNELYAVLTKSLDYANRRKIRYVKYNRDAKNKILVLTVK